MPDEKSLFQTTGLSWSEQASLDGLAPGLSPTGGLRPNLIIHGVALYGAYRALRYMPRQGFVIDFGCGAGRLSRFIGSHGRRVLGTEVTAEMLARAKADSSEQPNCEFVLTDGVALPVGDASVDCIWCCSVLRYSLFVPNPAYAQIAHEMFRVLRPGGHVVNLEAYVDVLPDVFLRDFERAGFKTRKISVLRRYGSNFERLFHNRFIPEGWLSFSARLGAFFRSILDNPYRVKPGLRDYMFVWQKPEN
jgi:SAM-dependent methyltransferase